MISKIRQLSEKKKLYIMLILIGVISFSIAANILNGFLLGDDEALFISRAEVLLSQVKHSNWPIAWFLILSHDHPPAPLLILMTSVYAFGYSTLALRLPNVFLWVFVCLSATVTGWRIGGLRIGFFSGLFLSLCGIYDIVALGFGMSLETLGVILLINVLLNNFEWNLDTKRARYKYLLGGTYLAVGYLFYISTLPVIGMYHAWFAFKYYKANPKFEIIQKFLIYTLPFIAYYAIYNLIFLGIPAYDVYSQGIPPYGQLGQTLGRANSFVNYESLLSNLQVLNWFVLPFVSWMILFAGVYYQLKNYFDVFIITLGYGLLWSFYIRTNTGQHFLAYFSWAVPFAIMFLNKLMDSWKIYFKISFWGLLFSSLLFWTYMAHIKLYSYESYPWTLIKAVWAEPLGWQNNIYRPVNKIAQTLDEKLGPNGKYISLIDSAFHMFYFKDDARYLPSDQAMLETRQYGEVQCIWMPLDVIKTYKIKALVSFTDQSLCQDLVGEEINYPGSNLRLTFLK